MLHVSNVKGRQEKLCAGAETLLGYNRSDANPAPLGLVAHLDKGWGVGRFFNYTITFRPAWATLLKLLLSSTSKKQ